VWRPIELARGLAVGALIASFSACNANGTSSLPASSQPAARAALACDATPPLDVLANARVSVDPPFTLPEATSVKRVYQPDWAGPVLFAPHQRPLRVPAHRFCAIEGEWTVPTAKPTINCSNRYEQTDGSSLWIAIDGWSATFEAHYRKDGKWHTYPSTDILQAGSESDVPCYHGGPLKNYKTTAYFWIEWSGKRNIKVARHHVNLPLHAGDKIYLRIAATTSGPHAWRQATLWLVNETTGYYLPPRTFHSGCVNCNTPFHEPATLFGNTAEWIVEATFYDAIKPSLPNTLDDFGTVAMTRVDVTDQTGLTYDLTRPLEAVPNIDWMTWNAVPLSQNGTLLACATIDGPREATFARAPYVVVTPGQQGDLEPKPKHCD
jgi:hypothetical protein